MFVIAFGNPIEGLSFVGPFETEDKAIEYAESNSQLRDYEYWVSELQEPGSDHEGEELDEDDED